MNGFDGCLELPTCRPQATALTKLLIKPATAGTSFEEPLALDCISAGLEIFTMNEFPRDTVPCGERMSCVVTPEAFSNALA